VTVTALAATLSLAACGDDTKDLAAADPAGKTLVYAHQQEPSCVFGGWIEQAYLSYQVLDSLTSLDENGKAVPWLATAWKQSADGLTWTFTLKDGVKFTDGTPVDAKAVVKNFDYWLGGGNSTAKVWLQGYYEKAVATSADTVQIQLSKPYPQFAETVSQGYFGIQSAQALSKRSDEDNCQQPIGSGAFTVQQWNRGQDIVLKRNPNYTSWPANAKVKGPAQIETIDWKFVPDATTRATALKTGEVDAIYDVSSIDVQPLQDAGFTYEKYVTGGRPQALTFNTQEGPFRDENVRKAFAYSLDRKALVEAVGHGVIPFEPNGSVSQATTDYDSTAGTQYGLDVSKAGALLDKAGWTGRDGDGYRTKNGKTLEVVLPYSAGSIINAEGGSILQGVAEQAKGTGFKVKLIPVPPSEAFAGAYTKPSERDIYPGYWTSIGSGILYINWRQSTEKLPNGNNAAFYNSPELEGYILKANSAKDPAVRKQYYSKAQRFIADKALAIGLYDRLSTLAVSPKVADVWQEHSQGGPVFHDAHFTD